jgi:uncharacterized protein (TIGR02118 family)
MKKFTSGNVNLKTKMIVIAALVGLLFGFKEAISPANPLVKNGTIKVTILYPNGDGKKFDMDYYANKHIPMVAGLLGDSLKMATIDKGIAGGMPGASAPFAAIGYLYFDKLSTYQNSFKPVADQIRNDIPNYTNIQPVIQISEVLR